MKDSGIGSSAFDGLHKMNASSTKPTVAVTGGGLAGLAAACALAGAGFRVTLFEKRPYLGGRASSYEHPGTGEVVDNCQHVLLGCCTNLIDFYRRTGVESKIRWYDRMFFLEPGGRSSVIQPSFLPAPLHTAPSFLRASCLSFSDKLSIARAMMALARVPRNRGNSHSQRSVEGAAAPDTDSFLDWLRRHRQTDRAIDRFWKTILVSALNEDLDRISISYGAQVMRESFLKSPAAGRMGLPTVPLTELYNAAGSYIGARGGEVKCRTSLEAFRPESSGVSLQLSGDEKIFDYLVLALPFNTLAQTLPTTPEAEPLREKLSHLASSPITGIHLWFDRQISALDHAVLLDRKIQWMFHKSRILQRSAEFSTRGTGSAPEAGSYVELVVSSSKGLVEKSRAEIVDLAVSELGEFFPAAREAKLLKSTVIKEVHATYSPRPGLDTFRPAAPSPWPRVFLAGDWTATGWPATMEGAVRSGYMAAQALAHGAYSAKSEFLVPDLPPTGFMRLFA